MANTDEITFQTGDVIYDTSKPSSDVYFIMKGSVKINLTLGSKKLDLTVGNNQFIGDAAVVTTQKTALNDVSYHGVAIALEPVKVVAIPITDIQSELDACSPMLKAWFTSFINRVLTVVEELANDK